MKRFVLALFFCASLLAGLSLILFPSTKAAENPLLALLDLPAPPPPNPQVSLGTNARPETFYDKSRPPADESPIEDLVDYWRAQSSAYTELGYNPKPSEKVLDRLLAEVEKDHDKVHDFLNVFRGSKKAAELVKEIYDRSRAGTEAERESRATLKRWLTYNSPHFSSELAREAAKAGDANEYVDHQEELLSLGRVDWERARPIVDRLYNGNQKVSRVLAQWALYRNALDTNSTSDTERYRDELKAVVEDKTATPGMRDLAFDALVKEKEWDGRDEWYYTLLSDETLDDLRVNGTTYTGLTTIMYYSPAEKYVDRMIELTKSDNRTVRTAAVKNLLKRMDAKNPEIIKALLPWLTDPKWISDNGGGRSQLVSALQTVKVPESVPALIAALDEKVDGQINLSTNAVANSKLPLGLYSGSSANSAANAAHAAANAANVAANAAMSIIGGWYTGFPLRSSAVPALGYQADPRAVPALRRMLNEPSQVHERSAVVAALFRCGGFTIAEQLDAFENFVREGDASLDMSAAMNGSNSLRVASNTHFTIGRLTIGRSGITSDLISETDTKTFLGAYIAAMSEAPSNELAGAVVNRIIELDRSDPKTALQMRKIVTSWGGTIINSLLMRDLKNNKVDPNAILKILTDRKEVREKQQTDVFDMRAGSPIAVGISACILEAANDYDSILDGASDETKTAMLACARMIRAPLPIEKVAAHLQSKDKLLALAAERYLETEDSTEARRIVLSLHANEAKILGASTAFFVESNASSRLEHLESLFASMSSFHAAVSGYGSGIDRDPEYKERETRLQDEVKKNPELLGIYSWRENFIRIYKDRAVLSWEDDPARYRERVLTNEEFDGFKGLLAHYKADDLPPFLACVADDCESAQLLMLGRNGGRRVFVIARSMPPLFADLDRVFEEMRQAPSVVKYWAMNEVPGLQLLFTDERLDAMAVWKNGGDLRLLTADKIREVEIEEEVAAFEQNLPEDDESNINEYGEDLRVEKEKERRRFENYTWNDFSGGSIGAIVSQPEQIEFLPMRDSLVVPRDRENWKARSGSTELRADGTGLYKVIAGTLTKIATGSFGNPVITPNGRWAIATKYESHSGPQLIRVNLLTKRSFPVNSDELTVYRAVCHVPSLNRVLVGPIHDDEQYYGDTGSEPTELDGSGYSLLDPETGSLIPARGEVRPLLQQTFRSLQPTSSAFDFWVAIPAGKETVIGVYNTRVFTVRPVLKIPRIKFDSMDMWVDEVGSKVYFVYEGDLLSVPIRIR